MREEYQKRLAALEPLSEEEIAAAQAQADAEEAAQAEDVAGRDAAAFEAPAGDYLLRGTAANGLIRAFCATSKQSVQDALDGHRPSLCAGIALGRLLVGAQMMASLLKDEDERMCLIMQGDGPLGKVLAVGQADGSAKGYVGDPHASAASVGEGVGQGFLSVVREIPGMEPMSSQVPLLSGEVGEDIAYYYLMSEQVPTSVGVGVNVDGGNRVSYAGGFIIQLMPGYDEELISRLEANLSGVDSVTAMLRRGLTPQQILEELLQGMDFRPSEIRPLSFRCDCNEGRALSILRTLPADELEDMVASGEDAEVRCEYCGKTYTIPVDKLSQLLDQSGL